MKKNYIFISLVIIILLFACNLTSALAERSNGANNAQPIYHFNDKKIEFNLDKPGDFQIIDDISLEFKNFNSQQTEKRSVRYRLGDLYLYQNNRRNEKYKIDSEFIEVMLKDNTTSRYNNFARSVELISENSESSNLKFKINKNAWLSINDLPAGEYKAYIEPVDDEIVPGKAKGKPFRLEVVVNVKDRVSLELDDEINLTINEPIKSKRSEAAEFKIKTNRNVSVSFESKGIKDEEGNRIEDYDQFFKYIIDNSSFNNNPFEFAAGSDFNKNDIEFGNFIGELSIEYFIPENRDWNEVKAGKYRDTVVVTVSAD
jgi:hypothetical protein